MITKHVQELYEILNDLQKNDNHTLTHAQKSLLENRATKQYNS